MKSLFPRGLLFFLLFSISTAGFSAEPELLAEKIKYYEMAKLMLAQGNAQAVLFAGWRIRELDPKDEAGYRFIVLALMQAQRYWEIPGEVYTAQSNGVVSAFLYQRQAEALFIMGGFAAGLYSLRETESFLAGKPSPKQVS